VSSKKEQLKKLKERLMSSLEAEERRLYELARKHCGRQTS